MISRVTVLTNPKSGHGNAPHAGELAVARFQELGIDVTGIVDQLTGMCGVAPDDSGDVDPEFLEAGHRQLPSVGCVAVTRLRVRQNRDAGDHGISLPGLSIPAGSTACLTACNTFTPSSPISAAIHGR